MPLLWLNIIMKSFSKPINNENEYGSSPDHIKNDKKSKERLDLNNLLDRMRTQQLKEKKINRYTFLSVLFACLVLGALVLVY